MRSRLEAGEGYSSSEVKANEPFGGSKVLAELNAEGSRVYAPNGNQFKDKWHPGEETLG